MLGYYALPTTPDYHIWKNKTKRFLAGSYPNDFQLEDYDNSIKAFERNGYHYPDDLNAVIGILVGYRSVPLIIETQKKEGGKGVNIIVTNNNHNSQTQTQTQSQEVTIFLDAIKYDVSPRQLEEIKQIIVDEGNDLEKAKPKISDKILSWGSNVLGGIVTNIITNPEIISNL